jgi:hypothetical protein
MLGLLALNLGIYLRLPEIAKPIALHLISAAQSW